MESSYCVYKHTSPNGKVYIGITKQKPSARFSNGNGYKANEYFYRAINKYGWENFTHEILESEIPNIEEASKLESHYIQLYRSNESDYGFNLTSGGSKEFSLTDETIKRKSNATKKNWENPQYRQKQIERMSGENNPNYGKKMSDECRAKMSESAKKRKHKPLSDETKNKISAARKKQGNFRIGKHHSEEAKRKISESNKGKIVVMTEDQKKKISATMKGRPKSEETRRRMSEAQKEFAKTRMKPVEKCDIDTGEVIERFNSTIEAAKSCGVNNSTNICSCCKGQKLKAYGYKWRYAV